MASETMEVETKITHTDIVVYHVIDGGPSLERIQQACLKQDAGIDDALPFETNRDIKLFMAVITSKELRMSADGALQLEGKLTDGGWTFKGFYNPASRCGRFALTLRTYDAVPA